jgi:hypothetical protein
MGNVKRIMAAIAALVMLLMVFAAFAATELKAEAGLQKDSVYTVVAGFGGDVDGLDGHAVSSDCHAWQADGHGAYVFAVNNAAARADIHVAHDIPAPLITGMVLRVPGRIVDRADHPSGAVACLKRHT